MTSKDAFDEAKRIMGVLVRQPPKPHEQMKIGKRKLQKAKTLERKSQKSPKSKKSP